MRLRAREEVRALKHSQCGEVVATRELSRAGGQSLESERIVESKTAGRYVGKRFGSARSVKVATPSGMPRKL